MADNDYPRGTVATITTAGTAPAVRIRSQYTNRRNQTIEVWWGPNGYVDVDGVTEVKPLLVLDLSPREVFQTLEALRGSRRLIALEVADKIGRQAAAIYPRLEEATDPSARVTDKDGDEWARNRNGYWACLTTTVAPRSWQELETNYGPLRLSDPASERAAS